jgi:hypothetical protein
MDFTPMKKWWVKLLLALAFILLALSAWFFGAGTQSQESLDRYRKQLLAAGERLDIDAFIPPRVDPDKNGAALIDKACWYIAPRGASMVSSNQPGAMEIVAPAKARVLWQQDEIVSVKNSHYSSNIWADLELDLANQAPAVELLQQAATYPEFGFGLDFRQPGVPAPHLPKLSQATALLSAKIIFDLHRRDTAAAVTNLHALLIVADASKNEPLIGSQANRLFFMQSALATQWELLQATNLTDEQLAAFQLSWTQVDFIKPMERAELRTRSTISASMKEWRAGSPVGGPGGPGGPSPGTSGLFDIRGLTRSLRFGAGDALWRQSWSYDDELTVLEGYQLMVETMRQVETNGYFKDAFAERDRKQSVLARNRANVDWLRKQLGNQHELSTNFVSRIATMLDLTLAAEAFRQCAITAIALKRHQLRHATLPKELNALVPEFLPELPHDPVDGKALRYRLNVDGTFLLYSIGIDGIDDGGDATPVPPAHFSQWQAGHDWVWPQPAVAAEVHYYYDHPPR